MPDALFTARFPHAGRVDPRVALEIRHKARLKVATMAADVEDLRYLLDVLGLWPRQDEESVSAAGMPLMDRADARFSLKVRKKSP